MKTVIQAQVLEVIRREKKDDPTVTFTTLILYEKGKLFPELIKLNVAASDYSMVKDYEGRDVIIEAEVTIYRDGKIGMKFLQGKIQPLKAAA